MATAPKDGSWILVVVGQDDEKPIVVQWVDLYQEWQDSDWSYEVDYFNYWMPIPKPPKD